MSIIQSIVVDCKKLDSLDKTSNKSSEIGCWRIYISPSKSIKMKSLYFLKKLHIVIVCTNGKKMFIMEKNAYDKITWVGNNNGLNSNSEMKNWLSTKVLVFIWKLFFVKLLKIDSQHVRWGTPFVRRGGGVEIVWFGVSERELKLKTTLQRRLVVKG